MADNSTALASDAILATDVVGGAQFPRVKVTFGVDGSAASLDSTLQVVKD